MGVANVLNGRHAGIPVWEVLDLDVDGGTSDVFVEVAQEYTYIARIIWRLSFPVLALDWTEFAGDTALTSGLTLKYNEAVLTESPIKNNGDFHLYGYDVDVKADEQATTNKVLTARWTFTKSVPNGLGMFYGESFGVLVSDDMTALTTITEFQLAVEGWRTPL